jgi:hypothetical protein
MSDQSSPQFADSSQQTPPPAPNYGQQPYPSPQQQPPYPQQQSYQPQPYQQQPYYQQPSININLMQSNQQTTNQSMGGYGAMAQPFNGPAFWVGFLCAFFINFHGIAHMMNGKLLTGLVYFALGWIVWAPILTVGAMAVVGLCFTIPLHIALSYYGAKSGATRQFAYTTMRA